MRLRRRAEDTSDVPPLCPCRLCVPAVCSGHEVQVLEDVTATGVHVLRSDHLPCDHLDHLPEVCPVEVIEIACSVGLAHLGHPEILISGLRDEVSSHVCRELAERVVGGEVFTPGRIYEGVLPRVGVAFEPLTDTAARELCRWSDWFARRSVEVLQLVWPDGHGHFVWQSSEISELLNACQPPHWRMPVLRSGALAASPLWPFLGPPEQLALTCEHIRDGEPIAAVWHYSHPTRGEYWIALCERDDHTQDDLEPASFERLVWAAPSLRELADLPLGWGAQRTHPDGPWIRDPTPA